MTPKERASEFVKRYPSIFTEDHDWWIGQIESQIVAAIKDELKRLKDENAALQIAGGVTHRGI